MGNLTDFAKLNGATNGGQGPVPLSPLTIWITHVILKLDYSVSRMGLCMSSIPQISESELEVMKVLWELGSATSSQIIDSLTPISNWKPKTIQTLITRLVAKGAVKAEPTGNKAFLYSPLVSEPEFRAYANHSFLKKIYNGSVNLMLASLVKEQRIFQEGS